MNRKTTCTLQLAAAMAIYGTLGLLRRNLPVPSGLIALVRGLVGCLFLLALKVCRRQSFNTVQLRRHLGLLVFSGAALGVDWILLFEAYRFTTVATATLCYYTAPILVVLASVRLFHENLTGRKAGCMTLAAVGIILTSGVSGSHLHVSDLAGIAIGLLAAVLYAAVILCNQKLKTISGYDRAIVQLAAAAAVLIPYNLLTVDFSALTINFSAAFLLLVAGVIHTGVAYGLYFGAMSGLSAQTVALMSYIDPVVAVVLSALVLGEQMSVQAVVGAVLVLCGAAAGEVSPTKLKTLRITEASIYRKKQLMKHKIHLG